MRRAFFSFHYSRDLWRVNQIRSIPNVTGTAAAGFADASLWEQARRTSDAAVHRMINEALDGTSVTVVCVGARTAGRKFINYEIERSLQRRNGLVAVQIHHLKDRSGLIDSAGAIPTAITRAGFKAYKYTNYGALQRWIEEAARQAGR